MCIKSMNGWESSNSLGRMPTRMVILALRRGAVGRAEEGKNEGGGELRKAKPSLNPHSDPDRWVVSPPSHSI